MAGRGPNHFLRHDARRAIRSAREAGLEVTGLDITITKDGSTTFRVHGAPVQQQGAADWNEATEEPKRKSKRREAPAKRR